MLFLNTATSLITMQISASTLEEMVCPIMLPITSAIVAPLEPRNNFTMCLQSLVLPTLLSCYQHIFPVFSHDLNATLALSLLIKILIDQFSLSVLYAIVYHL